MSIRINKVYTRSGDNGDTGLVGGKRTSKASLRVEAYGDIDELNAVLGIVKEKLTPPTLSLRPVIEQIQQELFDLGSELATAPDSFYEGMWHVEPRHVARLEELCDSYGAGLPELKSFILPGGSELASFLHLARTVCRRAERQIVRMLQTRNVDNDVSSETVQYVNRLSDFLFVLARWTLQAEQKDAPLWVPEAQRTK